MFSEGENVLAKKPTSDEFVKGTIVAVRGDKYKVQFRGGVEHTVDAADVKRTRTSRSQTRSRGRPAKSPGKSPTKKSPSRRSPGRRSPARSANTQARKLPLRSTKQAKVSIPRLEMPIDNSSDTDRTEGSESLSSEYTEPIKSYGPRRSIRIMSSTFKAEQEQKLARLRRNDDRSTSSPTDKKSQYDGKERGYSVQRDDDLLKMTQYGDDADTDSEGKQKGIDLISKPQEWGGWPGALLLMILFPIFALGLQLTCSFNYCSSKSIYNIKRLNWKSYIDLNAFLLYGGFLSFVAVISALPIGRLVEGQQSKNGRLQYRVNGIWILILSVAVFSGCKYQGYNISNFLLEKSLPLTVAGLIYGIILALALYIKGVRVPVSNLNIYGSTHNIIYDFWQGKEVNPRIRSLDIKLMLFRSAMISIVLINLAAICKVVGDPWKLDWNDANIAAILIASLQIIYALDSLIFEASFLTSFEILYEGTGYMLTVGYLTYPYLATVTTRYVIHHKNNLPLYVLGIFVILFIIGYVIYRKSNSQKDEFRKNYNLASKLESIPTKRGNRLIVSGLWGFVRHPNYLGDILIHCALSGLSGAYDILPYILAIFTTLLLIHRAVRDNARCAKRYGFAWNQYCSRVPYRIFKGVF